MFLAFHLEFIYFFYYFQGSYTIRPPEHSIFGINTKKPIASTIGFFLSIFVFLFISLTACIRCRRGYPAKEFITTGWPYAQDCWPRVFYSPQNRGDMQTFIPFIAYMRFCKNG
mgnify:CR=1 FL=1